MFVRIIVATWRSETGTRVKRGTSSTSTPTTHLGTPGKRRMNVEDRWKRRRHAAKAVKHGKSIEEVARNLKLTPPTIRKACIEFGIDIPLKPRGPRKSHATGKTMLSHAGPTTMQIVADLQDITKTMQSIANERDITKQAVSSVYQRARKAGINLPVRKVGRPKDRKARRPKVLTKSS